MDRYCYKRKVEELFLSVETRTSFVYPLSFFTCDSLTVLDFNRVRLNVPNTVSFPRIKLLRLNRVEFANGISLDKLLSNCPILEELDFLQCCCLGSKFICIANIALKNLHIQDYYYFGNSTLKICAPNLSTISCGLKEPGDFIIDSFPSLVEADINMVFAARASVIMKLLEKLSNEKLLKMPGDCFLVPCEADILLLPAFNNLIHLEVRLQSCYWGFESSDSVSIGSRIHEHGDAFEDNERQFEEEDGETYEDDQEEGDKQYPDREFEKYEEEEVEEEECEE